MKPTVAIIGMGLIGGSLGQALRRSRRYRVVGISRRARTLKEARRRGAIDQGSTQLSAVSVADIVVIATPVDLIVPTFQKMLPFLRRGAIVTDVGSVKGPVLSRVAQVKRPPFIYFVGGHPLAGSHKTGVRAARPDLFKGSTCVLVPLGKAPLAPLEKMWRVAGAKTVILSAQAHDRAVALISHLPHALAHALVHLVARHSDRKTLLPLLAGSFRDATRVASSDAEQWSQILRANTVNVRQALAAFRRELGRLEKALPRKTLKSFLRRSETFRRPLFNGL